ncbi:MAG TPA: head GIN domain-containing protein [Sphingobacteriaceae bacterium]
MKKFSTFFILTVFLASLGTIATASSALVSIKSKVRTKAVFRQDQRIAPFTGINVGGPFNVTVRFGQKEEIRMEGDKEVISRIETRVENGTLKINYRDRRNWSWGTDGGSKVKIFITVKNLKSLSVSGSGRTVVEGTVRGDSFSAVVSGSGGLTADMTVKSFTGVISGSGTIAAAGAAADSDISVSGSGSFRGKDLKTGSAEVRVSGSGNVSLYVESHLEASLSGSGNIRYSGDPHVDVTKSGSGSVSKS